MLKIGFIQIPTNDSKLQTENTIHLLNYEHTSSYGQSIRNYYIIQKIVLQLLDDAGNVLDQS